MSVRFRDPPFVPRIDPSFLILHTTVDSDPSPVWDVPEPPVWFLDPETGLSLLFGLYPKVVPALYWVNWNTFS